MLQPALQFAISWGELLAGAAILLGLFTRVAPLAMILIQAGAVATVTGQMGFSRGAGRPGFEYNLALMVMCLILVMLGGGSLAVDRLIRKKPATA